MKKMFYWFPLEIIENRYSEMSYYSYSEILDNLLGKENYTVIYPQEKTYNVVKDGHFLDPIQTIEFKKKQGSIFLEDYVKQGKVKNDDILFFDDIWNPEIINILYACQMQKIYPRIYGILHAGSHTPTDNVAVLMQKNVIKFFEYTLYKSAQKVFVGSYFHLNEVFDYFQIKFDNFEVHPIIFDYNYVLKKLDLEIDDFIETDFWKSKENIVVFPHRIHYEKQPGVFDKLEKHFREKYPGFDVTFVKTQTSFMDKKTFYQLLLKSKVIFASSLQENFGISILEGLTLGCDILLNNGVVYREFYNLPKTLYNYKMVNNEMEIDYDLVSEMLYEKLTSKHRQNDSFLKSIVLTKNKGFTKILKSIYNRN